MTRSRDHQCGGIGIDYQTHARHYISTQHRTPQSTYNFASRPRPNSLSDSRHTDSTLQFSVALATLSVCMLWWSDVKYPCYIRRTSNGKRANVGILYMYGHLYVWCFCDI
jgi:hypothetical protein